MKAFNPTITRRVRRRRDRSGQMTQAVRWFVNYRCPDTGQRKLPSFETKRGAEEYRAELVGQVAGGGYVDPGRVPTVAEALQHWLLAREGEVKPPTLAGYRVVAKAITGPLLEGTQQERHDFTMSGRKPRRDARVLKMLGDVKTSELTTAEIRRWHGVVKQCVGRYTANRALSMLKSALALNEEDFGVRAPAMPTNLPRAKSRPKKAILTPAHVGQLLDHAKRDRDRGIYYAFPFLTGTRISEQLGLLWEDVDFDANVVRICRIQERDGALTECTKTEAGRRDIPMSPRLREMLLEWRVVCPRLDGQLHRVFPGPGRLAQWPLPRQGGGGPLLYQNFRKRMWEPVFAKLDLPYVTPHSARHLFISTMQAEGIEVGLVAKLAGHASPMVTLGHYTQSVRGGEGAMSALENAYGR